MLLFTNGCSNTHGTYAALNHRFDLTWPNLVAEKLDYDLVDYSQLGQSNYGIMSTTTDFILRHDNVDKVVIQWSYRDRDIINTKSRYRNKPQYDHLFIQMYYIKQLCDARNIDLTYIVWCSHDHPNKDLGYYIEDVPTIWNMNSILLGEGYKVCDVYCPVQRKIDNHFGVDAHRRIADLVLENKTVDSTSIFLDDDDIFDYT